MFGQKSFWWQIILVCAKRGSCLRPDAVSFAPRSAEKAAVSDDPLGCAEPLVEMDLEAGDHGAQRLDRRGAFGGSRAVSTHAAPIKVRQLGARWRPKCPRVQSPESEQHPRE